MIYFEPHPVLFSVGSFEIRFYSLMYILGFIIAYLLIPKIQKYKNLNLTKEEILDIILIIFISIIIFARIFYVFYYGFDKLRTDPMIIFKIWEGGMSFHGGLLGAVIAGLIISKKKKINFFKLADVLIIPVPLALSFGRIGNLMNGELYGRVTNVPWAFFFPTAPDRGLLPRHPSQIYESIKNLIIFLILLFISKSENKKISKLKEKDGFFFWLFILLYGLFRFIIEYFREPEITFTFFSITLTAGQLLCALMVLSSIFGFWFTFRKKISSL